MKLRITLLLLGVFLTLNGISEVHAKQKFSSAELKRMSFFLSNFTAVGMRTFTAKEVLDPKNPYEMIHFGVWHNYIRYFHSRIQFAPNPKENGSLAISDKYVAETLKKYFNYTIKEFPSVTYSDGTAIGDRKYVYMWKNGLYLFEGADGGGYTDVQVQKAKKLANGTIQMEGYIHDRDNDGNIEESKPFVALAKPHKYGGKNTWSIISMQVKE